MKNNLVLIPVSELEPEAVGVIAEIASAGFEVLAVCYGSYSKQEFHFTFADRVRIFDHTAGLSREEAICEAIHDVNVRMPQVRSAVLLQADGRYGAQAVLQMTQALARNEENLIVGCLPLSYNSFAEKLFGTISGAFYRFVAAQSLSDASSGLLAFPRSLFERLSGLHASDGGFELGAVLTVRMSGKSVTEIQLPLRRNNANASKSLSEKQSFIQSARQNGILLRRMLPYMFVSRFALFSLSSFISFLVDWSVFEIAHIELSKTTINDSAVTLFAQVLARGVSSVLNFFANYKLVFKSKERMGSSAMRYFTAVAMILPIQAGIMYLFDTCFDFSVTYAPLLVQLCTFFINYTVQKRIVYRPKKKESLINL